MRRRIVIGAVGAAAIAVTAISAATANQPPEHPLTVRQPPAVGLTNAQTFKNCTALNKKYKHGVGRKGAHDHVSGSSKPVTNFTVNTAVYNANKKSDRDKDGIACEKR